MSNPKFIFISHAFKDPELYYQLIAELRGRSHFNFQDLSVPDIRLIQSENFRPQLRQKISKCDIMLIFTRPIVGKSPNVRYELETAKRLGKPIVGIRPVGDRNISRVVRREADVLIDWDVEQIVAQIRNPGGKTKPLRNDALEVDDEANAVPQANLIAAPLTSNAPRSGIKSMLLRAFGFSRHSSSVARPSPVEPVHPAPRREY